jgi:hypothetical protein
MIKPITLPRGIAQIFSMGDRLLIDINEQNEYRPDRVVDSGDPNRIKKEFMNNNLSNLSPISFKKGHYYFAIDDTFMSYFGVER